MTMVRLPSPLRFCVMLAVVGSAEAQSSYSYSSSHSTSSTTQDNENLTDTEKMCTRLGFDPKKNYDNTYDRYWSASSSNTHLKMDPKCASPKSNARDHYTAHVSPCNFTFHTIPEETYTNIGPMELSTMCSESNEKVSYGGKTTATVLQDYVYNWPDECVGDYKRCYSVTRDEMIIGSMFCKKHWTIPEGVTHVAVDCSADKSTKLQLMQEKEDEKTLKERETANMTLTEQMCVRNGYDLHRKYDTSYDRYWSTSSSSNKYLKGDPSCESPRANPRDHYTSHLSPCNFTFHTIPEETHEDLGPMELSSACSKRNEHHDSAVTLLQDYVHNWPDECVGDFQRCYSVERDETVFAARFCHKHWTIPDGVTHIGVDCSTDKKMKLEKLDEPEEEEKKKAEELEGLTRTEQICTRLGYDLNKVFDNSYESRHWNAGDSHTELRNNQPCASRQSNPRAKYTAHISPCNFTFHTIPEENHGNLGPMELSTLCSSSNEYSTTISGRLQDYVQGWPDECVGDFQRCYSVERDETIFGKLFCHKHWTIPEGVTHIGVDCMADKESKLRQIKERDEEREKNGLSTEPHSNDGREKMPMQQEDFFRYKEHEMEAVMRVLTVGVAVLISFCALSMFFAYKKVLKPFIPKTEKKEAGYDEIQSFEMNSLNHNTGMNARAPESPRGAPRGDLSFRLLDKA